MGTLKLTTECAHLFDVIYDWEKKYNDARKSNNQEDIDYYYAGTQALEQAARAVYGATVFGEGELYDSYLSPRNLIEAKRAQVEQIEKEHPDVGETLFLQGVSKDSPDYAKEYDRLNTDISTMDKMLHAPGWKPDGYKWDKERQTFMEIAEEK